MKTPAIRLLALISLVSVFATLQGPGAHARSQLVLRSVGGTETITISCHPLELQVSQQQKLPVVSPPVGGPGRAGQSTVIYTFDGGMPLSEVWAATRQSVTPSSTDQIRSFLSYLFTSHVLHFTLRHGNSIEYQLDPYGEALKEFADACVRQPRKQG